MPQARAEHTNGYAAYNEVGGPKIVYAACWAHARRKFIDAVKLNALDKESIGIVEKMDQLFRVDRVARETGLTLETRHALRSEESRPILERIKVSIEAARIGALPQSARTKACQYTLKLWNRLTRFLDHPELELSNNAAENSMRPVAIGRNNWIHVGSEQAGPRVAAISSIVETCRRLRIPVREYLSAVLPGLENFPANRVNELTLTLVFNVGAPEYVFNLIGSHSLVITGNGIVDTPRNSAAITNLNGAETSFFNTSTASLAALTNINHGVTAFFNTSTAGAAFIINRSAVTEFFNASTAGTAIIINSPDGGSTFFLATSTAANSTINNRGGLTQFFATSTAANSTINDSGGMTQFLATSTAANSTINTDNSGLTQFFATSTAANSTINTNNSGLTQFFATSTGGQARFITNAGGTVDISGLSSGGMTAGSIEGAGTYRLGSKTLTVGLNNLNTEVSGTITDVGNNGGTGGTLIKVGTGTLTLTGTNAYSGGTSFNEGILAVNTDSNLGMGSLSFNGGTLEALAGGGGITSSKAITLNAGGGAFLADVSTTSTLSGAISGGGSFSKNGVGTLTLTGTNTYSGGTTISAGTLQAGSSTAFSPNSAFIVNSLLDLNGNSNTIGSLAGTGTVTNNGTAVATLTTGNDNTNTIFSGNIANGSGTIGITKIGTGTLALTGANTYTGATVISAGTCSSVTAAPQAPSWAT